MYVPTKLNLDIQAVMLDESLTDAQRTNTIISMLRKSDESHIKEFASLANVQPMAGNIFFDLINAVSTNKETE